ncbi:MAG: CinA family protein [Sphingorhabdus sp.]
MIVSLAQRVIEENGNAGLKIATAESCTGGLVSAALTEIAGISAAFPAGYVTYSNDAKVAMLGVDPKLIKSHGAVSQPVVGAMAEGALEKSRADIAVSISGIAGPGGGSAEKPVGTVMFGLARRGQPTKTILKQFGAEKNRAEIRRDATIYALELLLE